MDLKYFIGLVKKGRDLSITDARTCAETILNEPCDDELIIDFLDALGKKNETPQELAAFAEVAMHYSARIVPGQRVYDMCGIGRSNLIRFNVLTTAAFVAAAGGVPVMKHCRRGFSGRYGSIDFLEALECKASMSPHCAERTIQNVGLCFLEAPLYSPLLYRIIDIQRRMQRRTIFNLLGPLTNPAFPFAQIIGVPSISLAKCMVDALHILGRGHVWVVVGEPGIEGFSVVGQSRIWSVKSGHESTYFTLTPSFVDRTSRYCYVDDYGTVEKNIELFFQLLNGTCDGIIRNTVALNAGALLTIAEKASSLEKGFTQALELINSGAAKNKFNQYRSFIQSQSARTR